MKASPRLISSLDTSSAHVGHYSGDAITQGWNKYCDKIKIQKTLADSKSLDNKELANFVENPHEIQDTYGDSGLLIREGHRSLLVEGRDEEEGFLSKSYVMPVVIESGRIGLQQKTIIALKIIPFFPQSTYNPIGCVHINETAPYAKLSSLEGICEYYPKIYGAYYGSPISNLAYTTWPSSSGKKPAGFLYMEMELAHRNLYQRYGKGGAQVPDSIVFEIALGQWATSTVAKLSIGDDKGRHHVLQDVDYSRAYHIENRTYLFSHLEMPKRIDLDVSHDAQSDQQMNCGLSILHDQEVRLSAEARGFLDNLTDSSAARSAIELFYEHFSKYIVREADLPADQKIQHFHIPLEFTAQAYVHESAAVITSGSAHQATDSLE